MNESSNGSSSDKDFDEQVNEHVVDDDFLQAMRDVEIQENFGTALQFPKLQEMMLNEENNKIIEIPISLSINKKFSLAS